MKSKYQDLSVGSVFGQWTTTSGAICRLEDKGKQARIYAECQCSCGSPRKIVLMNNLTHGTSKGCGSHSVNPIHKKFNNTVKQVYQRCDNPKNKDYSRYGGRGITVCFANKDEFIDYLMELPGYEPGKSIDRIDNDGNYAKGNLRWSTHREQQANRGTPKTNTSGIKHLQRVTDRQSWRVMIQQEGSLVSKTFLDRKFGGTEGAKQAAITYLEELLCQSEK